MHFIYILRNIFSFNTKFHYKRIETCKIVCIIQSIRKVKDYIPYHLNTLK